MELTFGKKLKGVMKKAMRQSDVIVRMLALTQKKGRSLVVFKKKGEIESDLSFV